MTDAADALVLRTFGEDFLAYVTASTPPEIRDRFADADVRLANGQENVLVELINLVRHLASDGQPGDFVDYQLAGVFGRFDAENGMSMANALRVTAGGQAWEPSSSNPVTQSLLLQLRDVYPLLLMPTNSHPFMAISGRIGGSLFNHPQRSTFEEAVMVDEVLAKIFPEEREGLGRVGHLYGINHGGDVQLWTFPQRLIGSAWERAKLNAAMPTVEQHAAELERALSDLVAAVQKKSVSIPVRIGLTGVLLPEGCAEIDLGWARVRLADDRDESPFISSVLEGKLQTTQGDETVVVNYSGDLVLEMSVPYKVKLKQVKIEHGWPQELDVSHIINQRIENLRLGLLLSMNIENLSLVVPTWTRIFDPVNAQGSFSWNDPRKISHLTPKGLTEREVQEWKDWSIRIGEQRQPSIDVAIRRALLAVTERTMPEDMLVDAVVVWENLFGAPQEATLRVTSSLAWLLADGAGERKQKQEQFKKIYDLRSRVVHGSHQLTQAEQIRPREAVNIALDALRAIFRDRPDLLQEKDGSARSIRMMLGE